MASNPPSSDSQPLTGETGTELRPCDSEACKALRERQQVRVELARLQRDYEIQRRGDVADEYQNAGNSWDTTRRRLTHERDEARATIERMSWRHSHPFGEAIQAADFCTCSGLTSWTGVDTAPEGPDKVWRCDHCGQLIELSRSAACHRFVVPNAPTTSQLPVAPRLVVDRSFGAVVSRLRSLREGNEGKP